MNLINYIKDKLLNILFNIFIIVAILLLLLLFNSNKVLIMFIMILLVFSYLFTFIYDYIKRNIFYSTFKKTLDGLDKKYLITEMIKESNFIDAKLLLEYLYEIDKAYHEELNNYKYISNELKEYIELWCHEIKTPLSTSKLIIENNNNKITLSILEEIELIEDYIEQVLFYSRSDNVEKDYIITNVNIKDVIDKVIKRNKKSFISKKIKLEINDLVNIKSDSKWLEFILNQIIVNSIKYGKDKNALIKISMQKNKNNTTLYIEDNGIGIEEADIDKVFDKGFTGKNGRRKYNSTGIGLYLCKKLCNKLGHNISISSKENIGTTISIIFPENSLINDV